RQQLSSQRLFGIDPRQVELRWRLRIDRGIGQQQLQLAALLIPAVQNHLTRSRRQQAQEIQLGAVADQVEVQTRLPLVGNITVDIEVHHQLVIGALQQRVVHPPERLRHFTNQAFTYRSAVVLAEDG